MKKIILTCLLATSQVYSNQNNSQNSGQDDDQGPQRPPSGFLYGAGAFYQQQIYKGFDQRNIIIPVIGYQGKKLNVFGPFINYQLHKTKQWQFDFTLSPRFNGFDASDSDFFVGMDKRSDSLDAGFTAQYNIKQWRFGLKALTDVLSKSDGSALELSLSSKHQVAGLLIEPQVRFEHLNSNFIDYYYGVTRGEANEFRTEYQAGSTINHSFSVSLTKVLPIGAFRLDIGNTWFGSAITDSPLVDDDSAFSTRLFFIRYF